VQIVSKLLMQQQHQAIPQRTAFLFIYTKVISPAGGTAGQ
jgi:hypothetical protein